MIYMLDTNIKFTESIGTIAKDFGLIPIEGNF